MATASTGSQGLSDELIANAEKDEFGAYTKVPGDGATHTGMEIIRGMGNHHTNKFLFLAEEMKKMKAENAAEKAEADKGKNPLMATLPIEMTIKPYETSVVSVVAAMEKSESIPASTPATMEATETTVVIPVPQVTITPDDAESVSPAAVSSPVAIASKDTEDHTPTAASNLTTETFAPTVNTLISPTILAWNKEGDENPISDPGLKLIDSMADETDVPQPPIISSSPDENLSASTSDLAMKESLPATDESALKSGLEAHDGLVNETNTPQPLTATASSDENPSTSASGPIIEESSPAIGEPTLKSSLEEINGTVNETSIPQLPVVTDSPGDKLHSSVSDPTEAQSTLATIEPVSESGLEATDKQVNKTNIPQLPIVTALSGEKSSDTTMMVSTPTIHNGVQTHETGTTVKLNDETSESQATCAPNAPGDKNPPTADKSTVRLPVSSKSSSVYSKVVSKLPKFMNPNGDAKKHTNPKIPPDVRVSILSASAELGLIARRYADTTGDEFAFFDLISIARKEFTLHAKKTDRSRE